MKISDNKFFLYCFRIEEIPLFLTKKSKTYLGRTIWIRYKGVPISSTMSIDAIRYRLGQINCSDTRSSEVIKKVEKRKAESQKRWEDKAKDLDIRMHARIVSHYLQWGSVYFSQNRNADKEWYHSADATYKRWCILVEGLVKNVHLNKKQMELCIQSDWINPNLEVIPIHYKDLENLMACIEYADKLTNTIEPHLDDATKKVDLMTWKIGKIPVSQMMLSNCTSVVSAYSIPRGREAADEFLRDFDY